MSDLVSLVFTVIPAAPPPPPAGFSTHFVPAAPTATPAHLGRAAYAFILRQIAAQDPQLAEQIHNSDRAKPLTCSALIGGTRTGKDTRLYTAERPGWLRFTGLTPAVSQHLLALAHNPPATIELDGFTFQTLSATVDPQQHPWANQTSYETLASPYLLAQIKPLFHLYLNFASPTLFRSHNLSHPVPLPHWVFGSLADRWNEFSPIQITPEIRRFAEECITLSRYHLRTRAIPFKDSTVQMGCVGTVRYTLVNRDRYWGSMVNLLAHYAFYSGVGYQTTIGLGQVIQDVKNQFSEGK